jgi:hypothetical protein
MGETPQDLRPEPDEAEPAEPAADDFEVVAHAVGSADSEDAYGAPGDGTVGWCIGAASAG